MSPLLTEDLIGLFTGDAPKCETHKLPYALCLPCRDAAYARADVKVESTVMMAPDGTLGEVPTENVEAATAVGFRVMTEADLRNMYQRISVEHALFKEKQKQIGAKFRNQRLSMRAQMMRRRGR